MPFVKIALDAPSGVMPGPRSDHIAVYRDLVSVTCVQAHRPGQTG
jgi:hypothetical protein